MQLKPGPLERQPYLVKIPRGLTGKLNKKSKNGLLQCTRSKPANHMRKSNETQKPQLWLNYTILQQNLFFLPSYALRALLCFWLPRSNHFQLYVNTTAFCKNAASGTQTFSICGRVFSCLFLKHKTSCRESQCDTEEKFMYCKMLALCTLLIYSYSLTHTHTHTHTHTLNKEAFVPHSYTLSQNF